MTDDQIRRVISEVLAARGLAPQARQSPPPIHPSLVRLGMVAATAPGSPCVIEPAVGCNQCGYCISMGH
jgi:hypothetical protein